MAIKGSSAHLLGLFVLALVPQHNSKITVGPPVTRSSRHVVVGCQLRKVVVDC